MEIELTAEDMVVDLAEEEYEVPLEHPEDNRASFFEVWLLEEHA